MPHLGSTWVREVSEEEGVTGQQGYEEVGLRCRDTGNFGEKGVSQMGFDSKAAECCSDTGKTGEKAPAGDFPQSAGQGTAGAQKLLYRVLYPAPFGSGCAGAQSDAGQL